jgi:acyl-coenzyme A thioesterase PaaI-like protein
MSFDVPRFCARFLAEDHNALMGLRYFAHAPGHLELELPYRPELARGDGNRAIADGPIMTLLDMAGTIAVWSRIDHFRPHATIDLRIDHLRVPPATSIRCAVDCFHVDAELARVRGEAYADTQPVASFAATYAFTGAR